MAVLLVVAAVLRFLFLAKKSFWFDEGVSVAIARLDRYNFARLLWRREANMSLYYLLLRGWLHLGHSEFFIRTLSILPALATLPLLYWLGVRLFDRRTGLIAATLLAFNAYHIRYSQEARSYSLFVFLGTLSCVFFINYLFAPTGQNRRLHVLASSFAVYAHFYAGLLILAHWLSLRLLNRDQLAVETNKNWRWIAILASPALLFAAMTGVGPLNWIQRPGVKDIYEYYEHMAGNRGWLLLCIYLVACLSALWPVFGRLLQRYPRSPGPVAADPRSWDTWRYQFLLLWLLFPVLITLVVSQVRPMFVARYFVICLPAFLLLAARGLSRLHKNWLLAPALMILVGLSVKGTFSYYNHDFDLDRDDWRVASYYVLDHALAGDVILFHIAMCRMPYEFYASIHPGLAFRPLVIYPSHGNHIDYRDFIGKPSRDLIQSIPAEHERIWVVSKFNGTRVDPDPTTKMLNQVLGTAYRHAENSHFPGIDVRLYAGPAAPGISSPSPSY